MLHTRARSYTPKVAAVLQYLTGHAGLSTDPAEVRACIDSLDDQELGEFDRGFFYLNMLSVFGNRMPVESIRKLADVATRERIWSNWECARYMGWIDGAPKRAALNGWRLDTIQSLLKKGRGLLVCAAHIGPYRLIPADLAFLGYRVCMAMDERAAGCFGRLLSMQADGNATQFPGSLYVCDVEHNPMAPIILKQALHRNEIVVFWIDGNLGLDGHRGSKNKCKVRFLNQDIHVKSGVPRMAMNLGVPLQCVFSIRTEKGYGSVICPPALFSAQMGGESQHKLAADWTQCFYAQLERLVLQYPQQWESMRFLHRWREVARSPNENDHSANTVLPDSPLQPGCRLLLDKQRVATFADEDHLTLLDVRTLTGFEVNPALRSFVQSLLEGGVIHDYAQFDEASSKAPANALQFIKLMQKRGLLRVDDGHLGAIST